VTACFIVIVIVIVIVIKKLHGLSPRANYTDRPSDHHLSAKRLPAFADIVCHVVSVTDPYGRILGFLDSDSHSRSLFIP
jgi:hypothetical protein